MVGRSDVEFVVLGRESGRGGFCKEIDLLGQGLIQGIGGTLGSERWYLFRWERVAERVSYL